MTQNKQYQDNKQVGSVVAIVLIVLFAVAAGSFFILLSTPDSNSDSTVDQTEEQATDAEQEGPSIRQQNNAIKIDMARTIARFNDYAADNNGRFPSNEGEVNELLQPYIGDDIISPITGEPYLIVLNGAQTRQGIINYQPQTACEDEQTVVPASSVRRITLSTLLADDQQYCIEY